MSLGDPNAILFNQLSVANTANNLLIDNGPLDSQALLIVIALWPAGAADRSVQITDEDTGEILSSPSSFAEGSIVYVLPTRGSEIPGVMARVNGGTNNTPSLDEHPIIAGRPRRLRVNVSAAGVGIQTRLVIIGRPAL